MKCVDVEIAVAQMFCYRRHIIVPNISWGAGLHECDLLAVKPSRYAVEVEIKVSKADLKKDAEKRHGHVSDKIKELYFAVPYPLRDAVFEFAPARAGIIIVDEITNVSDGRTRNIASIERKPEPNRGARALTEAEVANIARLGTIRIWELKKKLVKALAAR